MASVSSQGDDDDIAVDGINVTPLVDVLMVVLVGRLANRAWMAAAAPKTTSACATPSSSPWRPRWSTCPTRPSTLWHGARPSCR